MVLCLKLVWVTAATARGLLAFELFVVVEWKLGCRACDATIPFFDLLLGD